jgi:hypothetical protein
MEHVNARDVRYIILNGPSGTGKSTLIAKGLMWRFKMLNEAYAKGEMLEEGYEGFKPLEYQLRVVQDSFANPLKHFIASTLGVPYAELKKNTMNAILNGYTPREFFIHLSEKYIKDRYGDDAFGRWLEHRILRLDPLPNLVIIDDGGFYEERSALGAYARVVRITREGKTFEGDNRNFLSDPHYVLDNSGTIDDLEPKLDDLANWCIDQLPEKHRPPMESNNAEEAQT